MLTMYARLRGVPDNKIKDIVCDVIEMINLGKWADSLCGDYRCSLRAIPRFFIQQHGVDDECVVFHRYRDLRREVTAMRRLSQVKFHRSRCWLDERRLDFTHCFRHKCRTNGFSYTGSTHCMIGFKLYESQHSKGVIFQSQRIEKTLDFGLDAPLHGRLGWYRHTAC